jgi:solute:Na+ symporter, SSS family
MHDRLYVSVFLLAFGGIAAAALRGGRRLKTSTDFSLAGRQLNSAGVSWVIIGTLVGGASTIGTVQMAYSQGLAAWIFTLGSGLACLVLGLFFARPLREEKVVTVAEYLGRYFGSNFQMYCSLITSVGMFVHVVAQFLAAMAILQSVFGFSTSPAFLLTFALISVFVMAGGMAGAGFVGKLKFYLLYLIMIFSAGLALYRGGGLQGILTRLPPDQDFFNLFSYGRTAGWVDICAMIVGVASTQIYLQAIFSARDVRAARRGAFLSAAVIPPVGVLGIVIGLYLRAVAPNLGGRSAEALPYFLNMNFPPVLAAFFSAGLLLIVLGTGAGLLLGVTTNLYVDYVKRFGFLSRFGSGLAQIRACSLLVLLLSAILVFTGLHSAILKWSYLSMGLRGSAVFAGLCAAVFLKGWKGMPMLRPIVYLIPLAYILVMMFGTVS